jgi:hypothetical protein
MTLTIPLLLCLLTLVAAFLSQRNKSLKPLPATSTPTAHDEPVEHIEEALAAIRTKRERARRNILHSGNVLELRDVQVICEKGHQHKFSRFTRDLGEGPITYSLLETRKVSNFDHEGFYQGETAFGRPHGEGLGWVNACFGCPTCHAQRFSFAKFELDDYTTCGRHLVRKGHAECPLCAELDKCAEEEMQLLVKLHKSQFPQRKAS